MTKQNNVDLSEVKEVKRYCSLLANAEPYVNKLLETEEWILLSVDTASVAYWVNENKSVSRYSEGYVKKDTETVYVLGRIK